MKNLRQNYRKSLNADSSESEGCEVTSTSYQEDVESLKFTVVNAENMDIIKSKLTATSEYRRKMIHENHSIDLLENFPYFFTSHELVCGWRIFFFYNEQLNIHVEIEDEKFWIF